jgi:hypothetical protein
VTEKGTVFIGEKARLTGCKPWVAPKNKAVEDVSSLSNKGVCIAVHHHDSGTK